TPQGGTENVRFSACRMCLFTNNTLTHVSGANSLLKIHSGNSSGSLSGWIGEMTEIFEISDNYFTNGPQGGYEMNYCPQNNGDDERLRYLVFERNLIVMTGGGGTATFICGANETVRNNVAYMSTSTGGGASQDGFFAADYGSEPAPIAHEYYNNTCYTT